MLLTARLDLVLCFIQLDTQGRIFIFSFCKKRLLINNKKRFPIISIGALIKSNRREIRFFLFFILFFLIGQVLHYSVSTYTDPFLVHKLNADVSSKIINFLTPEERTTVRGRVIGSGSFSLGIAKGCEGIEGILLLAAAVCAFPMGINQKILGILAGSFLIYVSNLFRIVGLYYTLKYQPQAFDMMHVFVGQTFIIFVALLFFIIWINAFGRTKEKAG